MKPRCTLVLFDIDATLLVTGGAGVQAMVDAGRSLFGQGFHADGIDFAGRIDPLLLDELMLLNGVTPSAARRSAFRERYREHLPAALAAASGGGVRALPGVVSLLDSLRSIGWMDVGLLTGNFAETGRMKLEACGIDPGRFSEATAWGDDSPHDPPRRDHLPPVAMERFARRQGGAVDPGSVLIIGDTPHDVQCARVNGCRSLAVATGRYDLNALRAAKPDAAVNDLSATDSVLGLIESVLRPVGSVSPAMRECARPEGKLP